MVEITDISHQALIRKPTKPPPPPPLPPRSVSPARSCYSLPRQPHGGGGSECAESVCSAQFSTRSLQPNCQYYRPESTCGATSASCCQRFCSGNSYSASCNESQSSSSVYQTAYGTMSPLVNTCHINRPSPCPSTNGLQSQLTASIRRCHACSPINQRNRDFSTHHEHCSRDGYPREALQERRANSINPNGLYKNDLSTSIKCLTQTCLLQNKSVPPIPKERIPRPRLSISPMPSLKNKPNPNDYRSHNKCESLHYRRYVEQHIERVFKYLQDRKQRLKNCEAAIKADHKPQDAETILKVLAKKESQHLRTLRVRLSRADFQEIQMLGNGYIGEVCLVRKIPRENDPADKPNLFAMKKLKKTQVYSGNHMAHVMAERDILAEADNEWIVKLFHSFQDSRYLYFILEYIPGGDLMNLLVKENVLSEEWASFYIAEISLALQFVHDMGFIHRDIKPDNILIDARGHIKLTDFGLCTGFRWTHDLSYYKDDTLNPQTDSTVDHPTITTALAIREIEHSKKKKSLSNVGSPNYIAPEVLRAQAYGRQGSTNERLCDWWSVGVILYEMVIGYCPFIDIEMVRRNQYNPMNDPSVVIQKRILNWRDHLAFPSKADPNIRPLMSDKFNRPAKIIRDETRALIQGLLCDPEDRLCQNGIRDIQDHPFFLNIDWINIRKKRAPYVPELRDELDTSNFDPCLPPPESEGIVSGNTAEMRINDFTSHSFWTTPSGGLE